MRIASSSTRDGADSEVGAFAGSGWHMLLVCWAEGCYRVDLVSGQCPCASKYSHGTYLPKTIITIPSIEAGKKSIVGYFGPLGQGQELWLGHVHIGILGSSGLGAVPWRGG